LHRAAGIVKKEQTEFVRRHTDDERFGFVESGPQPGHDILRVERFRALQALAFGGGVVGGIAPNFGNEAFRREARRFLNRCPDHGTERQDAFVDRHKIDHVAGFATARCCHHLVHGKVNRMQKPGRFFYEV
jgi:hypothetical protein